MKAWRINNEAAKKQLDVPHQFLLPSLKLHEGPDPIWQIGLSLCDLIRTISGDNVILLILRKFVIQILPSDPTHFYLASHDQ